MKAVISAILSVCAFGAVYAQAYVPYSYYPPMEYGAESDASRTITSNTVFDHKVWGADKDEWWSNTRQTIVQLINENIVINFEINSGTLLNGQQTFVDGKRKGVFTVKGKAVTDPTSFVDSFWVVDQGSYPVLLDTASPAITFHVTINPTPPPGPPGGGG